MEKYLKKHYWHIYIREEEQVQPGIDGAVVKGCVYILQEKEGYTTQFMWSVYP